MFIFQRKSSLRHPSVRPKEVATFFADQRCGFARDTEKVMLERRKRAIYSNRRTDSPFSDVHHPSAKIENSSNTARG